MERRLSWVVSAVAALPLPAGWGRLLALPLPGFGPALAPGLADRAGLASLSAPLGFVERASSVRALEGPDLDLDLDLDLGLEPAGLSELWAELLAGPLAPPVGF